MKIEIKVEGCPYEDASSMKIFAHSLDLYCALCEVREQVRSRLKWGENLSDDEVRFLENLSDDLYVEGTEM